MTNMEKKPDNIISFCQARKEKGCPTETNNEFDFDPELTQAQKRVKDFGVHSEESFEAARKNKFFIKALSEFHRLLETCTGMEEAITEPSPSETELLNDYYLRWIKDLNLLTDAECEEINWNDPPEVTRNKLKVIRTLEQCAYMYNSGKS